RAGAKNEAVIEGFCMNGIPLAFKCTLSSVVLLSLMASCAPMPRSADSTRAAVSAIVESGDTLPVESQTGNTVQCQRLTDFDMLEGNENWTVVNDNIMGERSLPIA
ncbi:hypothetical protein PN498_09940, partial [Oscillatoria sp. CS-180]|uniref:hypothetical protein n=1 Tax=Oscillatoria sp. CS-180 TaxID=3021720 RepID=UPI00232E0B5B